MAKAVKGTDRLGKMVKTTKINVLNASSTSETVTKKTFAANERFIGSTTPRLCKLLTGICVGHAILLVATSTVFGVLLKAQSSEIGKLQEQKDAIEAKMGLVQDYESRISHLETYRTEAQGFIEEHRERIVELKATDAVQSDTIMQLEDLTNLYNVSIQINNNRLLKLEKDVLIQQTRIEELEMTVTKVEHKMKENGTENAEIDIRFTALETRIYQMETGLYETESRIKDMEANRTQLQTVITEIETIVKEYNTTETKCDISHVNITLKMHNSEIETLKSNAETNLNLVLNQTLKIKELEKGLDELNSSFAMESKILELESKLVINRAGVDTINERIRGLEMNMTAEMAVSQNQASILQNLASDLATVQSMTQNQSDAIFHLRTDAHAHNISVQVYTARLEELENKSSPEEATVVNNTLIIAELELSLLSYNFTIQAHSNKLRELENEANATQHFVQEQSNELAELQLSMLSYNFTLQTHNDILRELENDSYVTHQIIQDHSDALEDVKEHGTTYVRWGRTVCPNDAEKLYKGYMGGSYYMDTGSGANHLCLVEDPQWGYYEDGKGGAAVFGAEYRTGVLFSNGGRGFFGDALNNQDAVCAVCRIPRTTSVMIPGRNTCYQGWSLEYRYSGYLVGNAYGYTSASEFICLDNRPEARAGGSVNREGKLLYIAAGFCGSLPCPPYVNGRQITCVVCSK